MFGLYGSVDLALPPKSKLIFPTLQTSAAATANLESVIFMSLAFRGSNLAQVVGMLPAPHTGKRFR